MLFFLDKQLMKLELATVWVGGLVIFLVMFLVTAEVLSRRFFNAPIPGQVDIIMMAMVAFSVLCISYCYRQAGHIRMDLILRLLKGRYVWIGHLLVTILSLITVSSITPGTWTHFSRAFELGDTTFGVGLITWPSKLAVPIGLAVLWLRLTLELWVFGRLVVKPDAEPIGMPSPPDPRKEMDA